MQNNKNIFIATCAGMLLLLSSCKKDTPAAAPDPFYTVDIQGFEVKFTNQTTGASSYSWDFGDGSSSNEDPQAWDGDLFGPRTPSTSASQRGSHARLLFWRAGDVWCWRGMAGG